MCCSLEKLGYNQPWRRNVVEFTGMVTTFSAIAGVVAGVLAIYAVLPTSTALWSHVGLFGGVAVLAGITIMSSSNSSKRMAVMMAVVTALTLPVLFGSLGAMNVVPPHKMLWSSTVMCGGMVLGAFLISSCIIGKDCCTPKNKKQNNN